MIEQTVPAPEWVQNLCADLRLAGEIRLSDALLRLPSETMAGRMNRVAAIAPEALAAAKSMRHPWLELYVRLWALTSRIAVGGEGENALAEAWSLVEFSLRPDLRDCPQALSVVGNLVACHGNTDAPGRGRDCLDLCLASLNVMDPADEAFAPLVLALARIRTDAGEAASALACLQDAERRRSAALPGGSPVFVPALALALHFSGESRAALAALDSLFSETGASVLSLSAGRALCVQDLFPGFHALAALTRARILAEGEGDAEEARRALPLWNDVPPALHDAWTAAAYAVALRRPESNTWELGALLQAAFDHARPVGAHFSACRIAHRHARLALARESAWTAGRALAALDRCLGRLRVPGELPREREECSLALAALSREERLPVPASSLLAFFSARPGPQNPEKDVALLRLAEAKRPDDASLTLALASAMQACGAFADAALVLRAAVERHPKDEECFSALLALLAQQEKTGHIRELAALFAPHRPDRAAWCLAFAAYSRGDWAQTIEQAGTVLKLAPEFHPARRLLAEAAMHRGEFTLALEQYRKLTRNADVPGPDHWDLMTAAAAAGNWASVRETARVLNLEPAPVPPGEDADEDWGLARLCFFEEGEWRGYIGRQTSPVTAKILAVAPRPLPQHVGDLVAFAARPLPVEGEKSSGSIPAFRVAHTIRKGACTPWPAAGVDPGPASRAVFRDALHAAGISLWSETPENYRVRDPQNPDGEGLPGVCLYIVVPDAVPLEEADQLLARLTGDWPHPLCWLELATAAGADTAPHDAITKAYAL